MIFSSKNQQRFSLEGFTDFHEKYTCGIEYQIGITNKSISEFDVYKITPESLKDAIKGKANRL
ncbi:MAG: hypothetical protein D6687_12155 [Acidobacteria bacterium]|jgi:hypothetical protein|nr:MAG: hypothetical protein D6687_12155 [Acidobacteriota bacterium]GIU82466.1 MAG: hypothetical protein KatS3mg006_1530 [Pyrinomonadaceae bacterium]